MTGSGSSPGLSVGGLVGGGAVVQLEPFARRRRCRARPATCRARTRRLTGTPSPSVRACRRRACRSRRSGRRLGRRSGGPPAAARPARSSSLLPVLRPGDQLELLVGQVTAVLLGVLDDAVDELLLLLDLRSHAGKHLVCCSHCGVLHSRENGHFASADLEHVTRNCRPAQRSTTAGRSVTQPGIYQTGPDVTPGPTRRRARRRRCSVGLTNPWMPSLVLTSRQPSGRVLL